MDDFQKGRAQTLVATDIAARGIHVDDVALVIHADPPVEHKAYLHRSGRTARAGNDGIVVTMMLDEQVRDVRDLTRKAGIKPTTTRVQLGHPLLTSLAPGERSYAGGLVREEAPASTGSGSGRARGTRSGGNAGAGSVRGRGRGAGASSGAGAARQGSPSQGGGARGTRSGGRGRSGQGSEGQGAAARSGGAGRRGGSSTIYSTSSGGSAASFSAGTRSGSRRTSR